MFGEGLSLWEMALQVIALGIAMWGWYKFAEMKAGRKITQKQMEALGKMIEQQQKLKALRKKAEGEE